MRDVDVDDYVIIHDGNTPPHELHKLCTHSDWYVRAMVAQHPNVTLSELDLLSFDIDSYVRAMVREKICTMMFHNYSKQLENVYIKCEAAVFRPRIHRAPGRDPAARATRSGPAEKSP